MGIGEPGRENGEKPAHNCGVVGIVSFTDEHVAYDTRNGLFALQHRGRDGSGIVTVDDGYLYAARSTGLVPRVFPNRFSFANDLPGSVAIGHNRYGTSGPQGEKSLQPFLFEATAGDTGSFALAHNGNIPKETTDRLRGALAPGTVLHAGTDTEILGNYIAQAQGDTLEDKIVNGLADVRGAYSLVIATNAGDLIAVRDPQGMRPLTMGRMTYAGRTEGYMIASETVAMDTVGGVTELEDIPPGELVSIRNGRPVIRRSFAPDERQSGCAFEVLYIANGSSTVQSPEGPRIPNEVNRRELGREHAREMPVDHPARYADLIIGVPASAIPMAEGFAAELGRTATPAIKKIVDTRSFMEATHKDRLAKVRAKFAISSAVRGMSVTVVDDTIVRGNTLDVLVEMLRAAGSTEVHLVSAAPPVVAGCEWGVDINPVKQQLAALDKEGELKTPEQIAGGLGADSVSYLSPEGLKKVVGKGMCTHCLGGEHPRTGEPGPIAVTLFQRDRHTPVTMS